MKIIVKNELIKGILIYSKNSHPNEIILLLSGKGNEVIELNEVVIPPFAIHGRNFSEFKPYMIPFDPSIVGLVHSHPSGILRPSVHDLNHFYGKIMMIVAFPYDSIKNIAIFNRGGCTISMSILP